MPDSSPRGKNDIRRIVGRLKHETMLDIGTGSGTYAKMFPEARWAGVEVWEPYVERFGLKELYSTLRIEDAREWTPDERYDVAVAGDVLEHMTVGEARDLLKKLRACSDVVIVSIPIGDWPQGEVNGNPFEVHVTDCWTDIDVMLAFGKPVWRTIDQEIGVYVYAGDGNTTLTAEDCAPPRLKIAVYAISKNEEQFVERFCSSAKDADLILIADTGSDDGTVAAAALCGADVRHVQVTPWRFDVARNEALALLPDDIDVCISLDLDEVLEPGWREEIERVWVPGTTRLEYFFDWGNDIKFRYQKIHARHGYHWHHPVHEYPRPNDEAAEVWAHTERLLVTHKPDSSKPRSQYLPLLELSVQEDPDCPRNAFYLAREYSFYDKWDECIAACQRYLALPGATWVNERCYALRIMAKAYGALGNAWAHEAHLLQACAEAMGTREPWCDLGMLYYTQCRWAECFAMCVHAIRIEKRDWVYTCDPAVWGHWPHDLASIAAWHMGLKGEAVKYARAAVGLSPSDERLLANLRCVEA